MAKRSPITSPTQAVRIMQGAVQEIRPPAHVALDECDRPFWNSVVAEFARSEWTDHQLELAAMLARDMADAERNRRLIREEGEVLENGKANPRSNVLVAIGNRILATRRSLSLHARAKGGEAEKIGPRRAMAKAIEADNPMDDDLIGRRPSLQ